MSEASAAAFTAFAPAKVNLFLHVGPVDARDGYHPLSSLMVFADVGDTVTYAPAADLSLITQGAFALGLADLPDADNLVLRAARRLLSVAGIEGVGARLTLAKDLPIAAGLGGGSSDAGAALRLLRAHLAPDLSDAALEAVAGELGADGPACLWARPVVGEGRGDGLCPSPGLPPIAAVLVNPRTPCPTGAVYRAYDTQAEQGSAAAPHLPTTFADATALAAFLRECRNDLEAPAAALVPGVAEALALIRAQSQTLLGRLSGSGSTVFALCADASAATALAGEIARVKPAWWVRPCRLGGPWAVPLGVTLGGGRGRTP